MKKVENVKDKKKDWSKITEDQINWVINGLKDFKTKKGKTRKQIIRKIESIQKREDSGYKIMKMILNSLYESAGFHSPHTTVEEAMIKVRNDYSNNMKPIKWPKSYKDIGRNVVTVSEESNSETKTK
jgi:hypothetical protein